MFALAIFNVPVVEPYINAYCCHSRENVNSWPHAATEI